MKNTLGALLLACAASLPAMGLPAMSLGATLERVVIVERHGVRAPSKPPEALSAFSAEAWPAWPVPPGDLTPHGADALQRMGAWLRTTYSAQGLLPASGCPQPGSVFVWADGHDRRTIQSGDAVLAGLAPGCGLGASHGTTDQPDPIFDAVATGACKLDADKARAAVSSAMTGGLAAPVPDYSASMAALRDLLDPAPARKACTGGEKRCFEDGSNGLEATAGDARIKGPLATASTLAEALSLEYDEGFAGPALGWGRLDQKTLAQVMTLHNGYSALTRQNPEIAGHNGALLAQAILGAIDGVPAFPNQRLPAKLSIVLGHDTTISNLAGLLGVAWTLPGQPDNTPPDGAIVFEVYGSAKASEEAVKVFVLYQTADQLRTLATLTESAPPGREALRPACGGTECTAGTLAGAMERAIPATCRQVKARGVAP